MFKFCVVSYDMLTWSILCSALLKNAWKIVLGDHRNVEQIYDSKIRSCGSSRKLKDLYVCVECDTQEDVCVSTHLWLCFHIAVQCQSNHLRPHFQSVHCWWLPQVFRVVCNQQTNSKLATCFNLNYWVSLCEKQVSVFLPGLLYKLLTSSAHTVSIYRSIILVEIMLSSSSFTLCQITFPNIIFVTPSCKVSSGSHCLKTVKLSSFFHMQRTSCLQNYILITIDSSPYFALCFKNET